MAKALLGAIWALRLGIMPERPKPSLERNEPSLRGLRSLRFGLRSPGFYLGALVRGGEKLRAIGPDAHPEAGRFPLSHDHDPRIEHLRADPVVLGRDDLDQGSSA